MTRIGGLMILASPITQVIADALTGLAGATIIAGVAGLGLLGLLGLQSARTTQ